MDKFARSSIDNRRAFIEETANKRDLTPLIIEKDFWVCWTLRRLTHTPDLKGHLTFKGGTSLSKAYAIIQRFSEDIDLTIRRTAPLLDKVASPMEHGISGNERQRRTKALKAAAQAFVETIALPVLSKAIETELGTTEGWSVEVDPDDNERQTLLFNYPRTSGYGLGGFGRGVFGDDGSKGYVKPRIKLEFGARGDPDPFEVRDIQPYVAEEFPDSLPDAVTSVETLSIARTFWEKATILHALHHNGKLRDGLSRHYYDLLMLDMAGITSAALAEPDLLAQVVRNKSLMFADGSASYATADLAGLRISPSAKIRDALAADYAAMAEMFMVEPPNFDELLAGLADLEKRINQAAATS
ncbi:nucleotidyl transferase AbiEii/AbiGii toxin family protein [Sandarakinorhabdus sp. DWP1-3-1]|uniref:nucleotidyl transferase AbiEii/AbiGii toxin family protein n=1 Tax=Sandarakinorhabdus sp. DWP1-3-1 TaxID=2804627 RepID=UPI003CEE04C3